ncbi:MAG: CDP-diacylglycerol--serine O-phosphatidyltransferase [Prevotellaceae bacterium]|jgi:CDP-diacylglycerol--serine O-phosphatidyltransferase|nr:CDP-diacylglycerol--serine O-phosphatidyltransferase [Prevotellaceae bacterium]
MSNPITRHIPNTLTCLNLTSGCIACLMAFGYRYELAFLFIVIGATFDFFDGMMARLLKAYSNIGKDLDSLADMVSFGVAPSLIVYSLLREMTASCAAGTFCSLLPYSAFLIAVFSALRLAKFNNDTRQTNSFIGLPVPADALFWASVAVGAHDLLMHPRFLPVYLLAVVILFSGLLVSEIPMFSLKFKNLGWKDNKLRFLFLLVCIPLLVGLRTAGFAAIIVWYILLSLFTARPAKQNA